MTNAIKSPNWLFMKGNQRIQEVFPHEASIMQLMFLFMQSITKKRVMTVEILLVLSQFSVTFEMKGNV